MVLKSCTDFLAPSRLEFFFLENKVTYQLIHLTNHSLQH